MKFTKEAQPELGGNGTGAELLPEGQHVCWVAKVTFNPAKEIDTKNGKRTIQEFEFEFECIDPGSDHNTKVRKLWVSFGDNDKANEFNRKTIYRVMTAVWGTLQQEYPDLDDPSDEAQLHRVFYAAPLVIEVGVDDYRTKNDKDKKVHWHVSPFGFEPVPAAKQQALREKYGQRMMPADEDAPAGDDFADDNIPF
jgi:hypothetical protein